MIAIREIQASDIEAVVAVVVRCDSAIADWAPAGWRLPADHVEVERGWWQRRMGEEGRLSRVAVDESGRIAAIVSAGPAADVGHPHSAHLDYLFVEPADQGTGVGRLLLAEGEDELRRRGHPSVGLFTLEHSPAVGFYESRGWQNDGPQGLYEPFGLPKVALSKSLGSA